MNTLLAYVAAAILEIAGCFAFWGWLRLGKPIWWLIPGLVSLAAFAYFLTLVESDAAGRTYASCGGVYIVASLLWLWQLKEAVRTAGISPVRWFALSALPSSCSAPAASCG